MKEYIERAAALNALKIARGYCPCAYDEITRIPAADVAPVRHGKWKEIGANKWGKGGIFLCAGKDGCGKSYPYKCDYCPNCGAKMDLEG